MQKYAVTGMSCAACSARVEKAVSRLPGVTSCAVSLLTNEMRLEGSVTPEAVIAAIEKAGYGASLLSSPAPASGERKEGAPPAVGAAGSADRCGDKTPSQQAREETRRLLIRLILSVAVLLVLMYFSMLPMILGRALPPFYDNALGVGLMQCLLCTVILLINRRFFISGFRALLHRSPTMDTLVSLGAGVAYGYGVVMLFVMSAADHGSLHELLMSLTFESAAMILTLITVGKTLEAHAKGKTTDALSALLSLAPPTATLLREGKEVVVPVAEVRIGDRFAVRPGEHIPVDGRVIEGESAVNEAALTGESLPIDKAPDSPVFAGTVNSAGYLVCEATRVGEDTTLSQIIRLLSDAAATKAPIARMADKVSGVFVPIVLAIAALTAIVWFFIRSDPGFALARGISVLVISCPCALGLATPVAIMVASGVGAKNGILFKTAAALEAAGHTEIVVLDKTGTVTEGAPAVTDLCPAPGVEENELLTFALTLEQKSEHPLAKAILAEGAARALTPAPLTAFEARPGHGLFGLDADGRSLYGGSRAFLSDKMSLPAALTERADALAGEGKSPLFFAENDRLLGMIAVADVIRKDSAAAIKELHGMGLSVIMLTGDNRATAEAIGKKAGVDAVIAEVLPDGKEKAVTTLKAQGKVTMVGDGINDAPALTAADLGMAIGAGTDVAIDCADAVLMHSSLTDVAAAIRLGRSTLTNIRENLFWAFFYNAIGIPLAAGAFVALGLTLDPMYGAAAMGLSSFCVVTNALRLNFCKVHDRRHDKKRVPKKKINFSPIKEESTMKTEIKIEGMMCPHCEAHVKEALSALPGVREVSASHTKKCAEVVSDAPLDPEVLKKAIESAGYTFVSAR